MSDNTVFNTILFASDGSQCADHAFSVAAGLAGQEHARVVILHVTQIVGGKGGSYPVLYDEDEIRAKLENQAADLKLRGIDAVVELHTLRLGSPAHDIADAADSATADLIVVGSRGHSPISQLLLGSVPIRLLQIASCPVLVVPPARRS